MFQSPNLMRIFLFAFLFSISSLYAQNQLVHRVYLVGDAGELSIQSNGLRQRLAHHYNPSIPSTLVFLGDNIYPKGMPPADAPKRKQAEQIMQQQVSLIDGYKGQVYFIPGNHDWKKGGQNGWQHIQNQQQWVDSLKNAQIHFLPEGGCPGPVEVVINEQLVLVIIDSQWFLHPWDKPEGDDSPCEIKSAQDALVKLKDVLDRHAGKRVLVTAHHPIFTYGEHGGVFSFSDHLFPLRSIHKNLYLPLPVVGSVYPLYRKLIGNIQDISHPVNKHYRKLLSELLEQYPGTIYANSHEHTLQYSFKDSVHYVTSGSAAKSTKVKKKGYARYASSSNGFAVVDIFEDGQSSISFIETTSDSAAYQILLKPIQKVKNVNETPLAFDKTKNAVASLRYEKGRGKMLGINYRDEWKQEVEAPVFDIGAEHNGLKILQKGGGMQTLSLRLADSTGAEYTLRSIEKYPEKAVPEMLRKTFAQDLVQDQISAAHPYAALVVPPLAKAAGIYYTTPKLVYIPSDPRLGIYQREFSNTLALFEERPAGDAMRRPNFGGSKKVVNTDKVLEKLKEDNDNQVDQEFVVRSRLFDILIGDWDRHDDQWRWASFKEKKGTMYRPIPRDRDQAFFVSDGWLAKRWSSKWALPKLEGFNENVKWTPGFMFNARYFDRSFLNKVEASQWVEQANYLKQHVTDDAIEQAIRQFQPSIYRLHGDDIVRKIKARRDKLEKYALQHYQFLAKETDIPGSDKREWFDIKQQKDGDVKVEVKKINKKGEASDKIYERTFHPSETNEIRLFGLGGDDVFTLRGEGRGNIKVRIIGGDGLDSVANQSEAKALVYDLPSGVRVANWRKLANRTSTDPTVNEYNRKAFKYSVFTPLVYGNYNYDDGLFVGGGFMYTGHGFRKQPYKSKHLLLVTHSLLTSSYNFKYDGRFANVFGKWGINIDADVKGPNFVNNFFGWGNETEFNRELEDNPSLGLRRSIDFYRIRTQEILVQTKLTRTVGNNGFFNIGPQLQRAEIEQPKSNNRFIANYASQQSQPFFDVTKTFVGIIAQLGVNQIDNALLPARGMRASLQSSVMKGLEADAANFTAHQATVSFYQSVRLPARLTFASRIGGGINTGAYDLYNAQILDGKTELRGYRKTRFYGDSKLYWNNEMRLKLASFRSYLFPASLGIHGFFDVGRVWYKDANGKDSSAADGSSRLWHTGVGGGVWFTPFNISVISTEFGHGEDGNMIYFRLGFLF